jgi:hypothetical protein
MKDWFDVQHDIISLIDVPEVTSLLTGKIWSLEKPGGRTHLSDIVVGTLFTTWEQIQHGIVVINIHCPEITSNGKIVGDQITLNKIAKAMAPLLDDQHRSTFWTEIDAQRLSKTLDNKLMYVFRVHYYHLALEYNNL